MSIDFFVGVLNPNGYVDDIAPQQILEYACQCTSKIVENFGIVSEQERRDLRTEANPDCYNCTGSGVVSIEINEDDWIVNMTGSNAYRILQHLGIEYDHCGEVLIDDVINLINASSESRLQRILKMCMLGKSKGATHLAWG